MTNFFEIPPQHFVTLILANVDNDKLSDKDFREFIRTNLKIVEKVPLENIANEEVREKAVQYYHTPEDAEVFKALQKVTVERFLENYDDERNFIGEDIYHG